MQMTVLTPSGWTDYELLDSGEGEKLERFGPYVLRRPETQALHHKSLPSKKWAAADATFEKNESGEGHWVERTKLPERWLMSHGDLRFWARLSPFRHTGVFPEQAVHWVWMRERIKQAKRSIRVLDLFGYTALAGLAAAAAGANVTYVDASKPTVAWARENQTVSGLDDRQIRWLLDDALKFVRREARRDSRYDGIIVDPPAFGRGPKGEIWRFHTSFPQLMEACRDVLSPQPLFFIINAYAIELSPIALYDILAESVAAKHGGTITVGDLALTQSTPGPGGLARLLPAGLFGRWSNEVTP